MSGQPKFPRFLLIKRIARYAVPLLAFCFLSYQLLSLTESVDRSLFTINLPMLAVSIGVLVLIFLADAMGWIIIMRRLGQPLPVGPGMFIWFYSALSRYIPGVIWPYVSRIEMSHKEGVDRRATASSMLLENLYLAGTSIALAAPLSYFLLDENMFRVMTVVAVIVVGALLVWMLLRRFRPFTALRDKYLGHLTVLSPQTLTSIALYYCIFWMLFGFVFAIFCSALINLDSKEMLIAAMAFPVSFSIGFIASISPGGLGIREGVLYFLLVTHLPAGEAALLSVTSRIWLMSVEASIAGVLILRAWLKKSLDNKG